MVLLSDVFGEGFDANEVEPMADFELLPAGYYVSEVESIELKETKKGDGYFLKVIMSVLDGDFKGRKIFDNINIANPSEMCVKMGKATFAALCLSAGEARVEDPDVLLGKVVVVSLKVKGENNDVRTYLSVDDYNKKLVAKGAASPAIVRSDSKDAAQDSGPDYSERPSSPPWK